MKITVAAIQLSIEEDYQANIDKAVRAVFEAYSLGARIILLPELFQRHYFCQREDYERFSYAEEYETSQTLATFQSVAKALNVVLPISFFEKSGNCYYNSLCVISETGEKLGLYRKSHIPTGECYEEKFYFTPGDTGFKVFDTSYGKVGIGICWDQWFSETGRLLALKGADFIFFPTAIGSEPVLPYDTSVHWKNALIGQAALNLVPVIAANRIGSETDGPSSMTFFGNSLIADEVGTLVSLASNDKEQILVHEFDLDEVRRRRTEWGIFRDRRCDLYGGILKTDLSKEEK